MCLVVFLSFFMGQLMSFQLLNLWRLPFFLGTDQMKEILSFQEFSLILCVVSDLHLVWMCNGDLVMSCFSLKVSTMLAIHNKPKLTSLVKMHPLPSPLTVLGPDSRSSMKLR